MNIEHEKFLKLTIVPARLTPEQTAWRLGFQEHDIRILTHCGLLRPLGHPAPNGSKYFAAVQIEALAKDERWLGKASDAVCLYWRNKKKSSDDDGEVAMAE